MRARVDLVMADLSIASSYPIGAPRGSLRPLHTLEGGRLAADAADALLALHRAISAIGGDLRITDCYRSLAVQQSARQRYEAWLSAGSPKPGSSGFNAATMKADYVAEPGYSFHNAGRAIDLHVDALKFPAVPADRQLDRLWELCVPIGWSPVITTPREGASESWHLDYLGPWGPVRARRGYAEAAMGACLDLGATGYGRDTERAIQAQLHRAGYDVGAIDGVIGPRTIAALQAAGVGATCRDPSALYRLPSSPSIIWTR